MGYFKNALSGFKWMGAYRGITRIGAYVRIAILARILNPDQFGVFGVASLTLALLETFTQTGVSVYLIQERKKLEEYIDSAWLISVLRGVFMFLLLYITSPLISSFFKSPEALALLRLISLVALIRGFINPSRMRYMKDLMFKEEFWISMSIFLVDSIGAIIISFVYGSPIGLVWGLILGAIFEVVFSVLFIKPRPTLSINIEWEKIREMLSRSKWVTGAAIFDYLYSQGDDVVVGRLTDTYSLGIYQQAYKISTLPLTEITKLFNQFTFPVYSNISDDTKRLKKAFYKTSFVILLMVIPIGVGLLIFADLLVKIVLGDRWTQVVPIVKALSVFGITRAFIVSTYPLFNSLKKQKYITVLSFVQVFLMGITIFFLTTSQGAIGASISVLISSLLTIPFILFIIHKQFKTDT